MHTSLKASWASGARSASVAPTSEIVVVAAGMVGNATAADMTAANIRTFKTCAYYLPLAGIVASLVVFLLAVKIDENMHDHIVEQLEERLASEETDKQ